MAVRRRAEVGRPPLDAEGGRHGVKAGRPRLDEVVCGGVVVEVGMVCRFGVSIPLAVGIDVIALDWWCTCSMRREAESGRAEEGTSIDGRKTEEGVLGGVSTEDSLLLVGVCGCVGVQCGV